MPDETFDAVMVGGGTKGLFLAMYLTKYGGMSVGIFERRHEIGGCLATEEIAAPGFRGDTHANMIFPFYYSALYRDFPEFWDYGAQWDQYLCSSGAVFENNNSCLAIYGQKYDPTQERTAKEIARFSEKDAERWLKFWKLWQSDEMLRLGLDSQNLLGEERMAPEVTERRTAFISKVVEAGLVPDSLIMAASAIRAIREYWESEELQTCILRWAISACMDINESGRGVEALMYGTHLPAFGFNRGGTHQIAHAAHQILVQNGCKFFTHTEVDKIIIENGTATGIRLTDGSEIKARKLVVCAGMSPAQLCFDLIGREHIDDKLARRVELLETTFGCLFWYTLALHEAPKYTAAEFNPDINETFWLSLAPDPDPIHLSRECYYGRMGLLPPNLEDYCPTVWSHSLVDPSFAPPGKHVAHTEQLAPPATAHTEREWLEIKKRYAEDLMTIWQRHAPNMTWDNVIGVDSNTPYDNLRMKNFAPNGCWAGVDRLLYQVGDNRPTPELADHRTPVKNLYATGGAWSGGSNASSMESYKCYRVIATDLGLGKPWEEPGKEEPDSLVEQHRNTIKKARDQFKRVMGEQSTTEWG